MGLWRKLKLSIRDGQRHSRQKPTPSDDPKSHFGSGDLFDGQVAKQNNSAADHSSRHQHSRVTSPKIQHSIVDPVGSMNQYSAPQEAYLYTELQHLDSIRLLTLHPGDEAAPLECSLSEVSSESNPQYEALSYTWASTDGDTRQLQIISCDGRRLMITRNCKGALRRLRYGDRERVLWVDAICIDQENEQERGHQVGLMRKIYGQANEVLIWLGYESQRADEATGLPVSDLYFEHLKRMAMEMRELEKNSKTATSSPLYQQILSDLDKMRLDDTPTSLLRGLFYVHDRPWWSRIWVLQEAVVAKRALLICSKQTAEYSDLTYFYEVISGDRSAISVTNSTMTRFVFRSAWVHLSSVRWISQQEELTSTLLRLLQRARQLKASDARDKIFGILGLSPALSDILPAPEYSKSASEVFVEVAIAYISHSQSLGMLYSEMHMQRPVSDHPTWAPDWSRPVVTNFDDPAYYGYNATRKSKVVYERRSTNGRELRVMGKQLDGVQQMSNTAATLEKWGDWERTTTWKASCSLGLSLTTYPTGEAVEDALWRTLCWNTDRDTRYPALSNNGAYFKEWLDVLTSSSELDVKTRNIANGNRFANSVALRRYPLCVTASGLLASVPYMTEVGDHIVLLSGASLPFVIRPIEGHYSLVGPCYVHGQGIMDGEAWPHSQSELEWFSIW